MAAAVTKRGGLAVFAAALLTAMPGGARGQAGVNAASMRPTSEPTTTRAAGGTAGGAAAGVVMSGAAVTDPNLAERLADLASETLQAPTLSTARYRQAGLLFEAAEMTNPAEARFPRLRYEAMLQAGEISDAIAALVRYARMDPTDLQAQVRLIELYAQRMETADAKLRYLREDILPAQGVPAEVRSQAALLAARVLLERGERKAAAGLAADACRLNQYNAEALRLRFDLSLRDGAPGERLQGLLAIARASPLDIDAISAVAAELDEAGLSDSAAWFDAAVGLAVRSGSPPPRTLVNNYATRMLLGGTQRELRDSEVLVTQITKADPADLDAQIIRLAIAKLQGDMAAVSKGVPEAVAAGMGQLGEISADAQGLVGDGTTRPAATDIGAVADKVKENGDAGLKAAFATAAGNLAFVQLYFQNDAAAAAPAIEALRKTEPTESALLARLDGWTYLVQKKEAEARLKLSAVEKTDPLASIGLLRLEGDKAAADLRARSLRAGAHGISGAIVAAELAERKTPQVLSAQGESLRRMAGVFPIQLLRLIDDPQAFYALRAVPVSPSTEYGQPQMVRVMIQNISSFDLPLGPHGAIHPGLWFDAVVRGLHQAKFPNTAFDTIAGPLVLRPGQVASRVVRLDQKQLLVQLRTTPYYSVPISAFVTTNPVFVNGRVAGGPGGYQAEFSRLMERAPLPIVRPEQRDAFVISLTTAPAERKVALIDAAVEYAPRAVAENHAEFADQLNSAMRNLLTDPDPVGRSWAAFQVIRHSGGTSQSSRAQAAAADPYWLMRMLSLTAVRAADADVLRAQAERILNDPQAVVARYARATLDEMEEAATTQAAGK